MLKSALDLRESEGKRQTNARVRSARYLCFPRGMQWNMGHSLVRMRIGGRLHCKHQTNNRSTCRWQCKGGSRGSKMPTRFENWVTGAGQVLTQLSGMLVGRRSSEELEVAQFTRRFRKGFTQMKDRLEAPAEKSFRGSNPTQTISNPTGSNRRQLDRPFPYIIIGAIVAVGLAFDLALIINAGGIPGVTIPGVTIPGVTQTANVNKVATKVAAVVEVVDDLAGDEEEYIVEDIEALDDYDDDLPSLPVLDFTDEYPDKGS